MEKLIKYVKNLFDIYIVGTTYDKKHDKKHDCLKNKQLVEEYPLYGDPYGRLLTKGYRFGTGYIYKCSICGMDWHE